MRALFGRTDTARSSIDAFAKQLDLSPAFVRSYLEINALTEAAEAASGYEEFLASLPSLSQMYVAFALSTAQRGQEIFQLIASDLGRKPAGAYLDIGCGYGGFVRTFAASGLESVGVEIVPQLAEYSRKNCTEFPNARIIEGSFLSIDPDSLGYFDCITCNDVIEHIEDPPETIARIARMLKPGGILMMEIPNRSCLHWLPSDGHFQLFGISSLPRDSAGRYFREALDRDDYFGHMGEFYDSQVYLDLLKQNGLDPRMLDRHLMGPIDELPAHAARALDSLSAFNKHGSEKLHPITKRSLQVHVARTVAEALNAYAEARRTGVYVSAQREYMQSFWTVIARRPA